MRTEQRLRCSICFISFSYSLSYSYSRGVTVTIHLC
nr:MAG TPA: Kruppel-like factor 3 finger, kruppel-like, DNA BINDING [Caudoviricetes sp.]